MEKKGLILILGFVLVGMLIFVSADTLSKNDREIQIIGCSMNKYFTPVNGCLFLPDERAFWCKADNNLLDVFAQPNACSRDYSTDVHGYYLGSCCPKDGLHHCEYLSGTDSPNGEGYYCTAATKNCEDLTYDSCLKDSDRCYWDNQTTDVDHPDGMCLPNVGSCYGYNDKTSCQDDKKNVSQNDPNCRYGETQSGGIPYTISQDTCRCFWNDPDSAPGNGDEYCGLVYNVTSTFGNGGDYGLCSYFLYPLSGCNDEGFQEYSYNATYKDDGNGNGVNLGVLDGDARCTTRTGRKRCGDPVVKVPFFSFVNLFLVSLLICLFYISRNKFKVIFRK